jgi:hypothetical protein
MLRKEENKTEDTDSCDPTTSSDNETESNSPKMNSADKVDLLSEHICFLFIDIATVVLVGLGVGDFQTKGYLSSLIVTAFVFSSKSVYFISILLFSPIV